MAQMTAYSLQALMDQLSKLSNIDEIAPKMLNSGLDPLEAEIKKNAGKHSRTGAMRASLKRKKAKKDKNGVWSQKVQFEGYDKTRKPTASDPRGVPNARKAMSLEYGTSKQPATPFIRPAVAAMEQVSIDAMQRVFDLEVNK